MNQSRFPYAVLSKKQRVYFLASAMALLALASQVQADTVESSWVDRSSNQPVLVTPSPVENSGTAASVLEKEAAIGEAKNTGAERAVSEASASAATATTAAPTASAQVEEKKATLTLEEYSRLDATTLSSMVREGKVTSSELVDLALEMIQKTNPELNSVISLRADEAKKEAAALKDSGQPFLGVPILVKGLGHSIKGGDSSNGLMFLQGQTSKLTSSYVKALQAAGFVVVGQANYPEMGWINVTTSDSHGATHNPWNLAHNPGGSSGGSSAAVAIGQVPLASASDGGGSIRIPASWSGTVGFFPTLGVTTGNTLTAHGQVVNFAMTRTMDDTERLFDTLLKEDVLPNTLDKNQVIAYTTKTPAGTAISPDAVQAVHQAVAELRKRGYTVKEVDYPIDGEALMKSYYAIAANSATTVNFLAKQKLKRALQKDDVELLTWALYQAGSDLTKEDMAKAYAHIDEVRAQMDAFFKEYPIFLTPTNAFAAPEADYHHIPADLVKKLEDMSGLSKDEKMQLIYDQWLPAWTLTPFTQLANLTQTPAISLPTYVTKEGLPMGIMFHSYRKNDRALLALGREFETAGLFQTLYAHRLPTDEAKPNEGDKVIAEWREDDGTEKVVSSKGTEVGRPVVAARSNQAVPLVASGEWAPSSRSAQHAALPQTGEEGESSMVLLGILSLFGIAGFMTKREKE